jgi:hypothetical protein
MRLPLRERKGRSATPRHTLNPPSTSTAVGGTDRLGVEKLPGHTGSGATLLVRNSYKHDTIELVPAAERPPRLFAQLRQLHAGLVAIGTPPSELWRLLAEVALGGIHRDRRRVIEVLVGEDVDLTTSTVGGRIGLPTTTARRHLEHLMAVGVVDLVGEYPERWRLSEWVRERWWTVEEPTVDDG